MPNRVTSWLGALWYFTSLLSTAQTLLSFRVISFPVIYLQSLWNIFSTNCSTSHFVTPRKLFFLLFSSSWSNDPSILRLIAILRWMSHALTALTKSKTHNKRQYYNSKPAKFNHVGGYLGCVYLAMICSLFHRKGMWSQIILANPILATRANEKRTEINSLKVSVCIVIPTVSDTIYVDVITHIYIASHRNPGCQRTVKSHVIVSLCNIFFLSIDGSS